jgi:hypothetical protein
MTLSKAYSQYGADMGRRSDVFPEDFEGEVKVLEMHLDGDYDSGGAYWGGVEGTSIWRLTAETPDGPLVRYVRSRSFSWLSECERMRWGSRVRLVKEIGDDRIEQFVMQYERTALWSSNGEDEEPLDSKEDIEIADETRALFRKDCEAFLQEADVIAPGESDSDLAHDFWLTRNGHGAGFWDGDYEEEIGEKLTALAKKFRKVDLYVGDDGKVYQS